MGEKKKNKKKGCLASFCVIVVLFIVLIAVASQSDSNDTSNESSSNTASDINNSENGTNSSNNNETTYSIDNAVQSNDKWKMTYKECISKTELDPFTVAEEGTEFVIVYFEIENISTEAQNFNIIYEEFYLDEVKTPQTIYGVVMDSAYQLTAISVEPGKKANGYFLFQTTPNWKELEIIYNEDLYKEDNENVMRFLLTNNKA